MTPTGLDQSWGFADPKAAAKAGVRVVSMYLSHDQSKNITASDVKAYHKVGIALILNWENNAGAPLAGAAQGRADAVEAVRQAKALIKAVGYRPASRLVIYFSCDKDVNAGQFGPIFAYYRAAKAVCAAAGFGVGAYGEADLVTALSTARITDAEWQTVAWSRGVLSPAADFYQSSINETFAGASVDFDRIIHAAQLGAWWPANHELNSTSLLDGLDMTPAERSALIKDIVDGVWQKQIADPTSKDPKAVPPTTGAWLVWDNKKSGAALEAARAALAAVKAQSVVVDAAAVAADIKHRVITLLGGQP